MRPPVRRHQAEQGAAERGLAAAGLADQAEHLAAAAARRSTPSTALTTRAFRPNRRENAPPCSWKCTERSSMSRTVSDSGPDKRSTSGFVGNGDLLPLAAAPARSRVRRLARPSLKSAAQHWARLPPWCSRSTGCRLAQIFIASGQRGWKRQPGGGSTRSGGAPVDVVQARGPQRDRGAQQLAGVGVLGPGEDLPRVADLDDLAGVHHRHPVARLGDDAEVVGDQQQGRVGSWRAGRGGSG